jgi:hypothetical protein
MGQYHYLCKLDKKEFLNPHKFDCGLKAWEIFANSSGGPLQCLGFLLCSSNGRGGGDFSPEGDTGDIKVLGRWAGDRIAIVGDYSDRGDLPDEFKAETIYGACGNSASGWVDIYAACKVFCEGAMR